MRIKIFAVKDELGKTFLSPSFFRTKEEAERDFKNAINTIPLWKNNASDFSLYHLADYDEETGIITPEIEKIGSGHTYLKAE